MTSPAQDFKSILLTAGVGSTDPDTDWGVHVSKEPESPHRTITIYDTGGAEPNAKHLLDFNTVQVRVRGNVNDYPVAHTKIKDVKNKLLGLPKETVNGTVFVGVWAVGDIIFLKYDDNNRPIFVSNWRTALEPASGTNRTPLTG